MPSTLDCRTRQPKHRHRVVKMEMTAIFDIGKTNKKFLLFDRDLRPIFQTECEFTEIKDEDGFPTEDLGAVSDWVLQTLEQHLKAGEHQISAVNFTAYGASFVHLGGAGKPIAPLYNYLKPLPDDIALDFYEKYGPEADFERATASPSSGMLNSGMQLYWLKYARPEIYAQIKQSLHFPQYLAYLISGQTFSEYSSIGCHTGMWDYAKNDYHAWLYTEGIAEKLPPLRPATTVLDIKFQGKTLRCGIGIHDSSSALFPFVHSADAPFLLLSTGTWCVSMNPYGNGVLAREDIGAGCLCYMQPDGRPLRAARLFLGNEHAQGVARLQEKYGEGPEYEQAYRIFLQELVEKQAASLLLAKGNSQVKNIYVEGGFTQNTLFLQLLRAKLPDFTWFTAENRNGAALGAALLLTTQKPPNATALKKF
jgi:sugar (pentulose or hexulose) kinase